MMRRNGENGSGNGNGSSSQGLMSKLHQCEIHMKPRKRKNFLQAWLNKFPSRAKKIAFIKRERPLQGTQQSKQKESSNTEGQKATFINF